MKKLSAFISVLIILLLLAGGAIFITRSNLLSQTNFNISQLALKLPSSIRKFFIDDSSDVDVSLNESTESQREASYSPFSNLSSNKDDLCDDCESIGGTSVVRGKISEINYGDQELTLSPVSGSKESLDVQFKEGTKIQLFISDEPQKSIIDFSKIQQGDFLIINPVSNKYSGEGILWSVQRPVEAE